MLKHTNAVPVGHRHSSIAYRSDSEGSFSPSRARSSWSSLPTASPPLQYPSPRSAPGRRKELATTRLERKSRRKARRRRRNTERENKRGTTSNNPQQKMPKRRVFVVTRNNLIGWRGVTPHSKLISFFYATDHACSTTLRPLHGILEYD